MSNLGIEQAKALAEELTRYKVIKIISSPLRRTRETAEVVAERLGLEVSIEPQIIENNTLLVTHDNIVRVMICLAKHLPINDLWNFDLEPASINIFEMDKNGMISNNTINYSKHLLEFRSNIADHAL